LNKLLKILLLTAVVLSGASCGSQNGDDIPTQEEMESRVKEALKPNAPVISSDSASVKADSSTVNP
jgi:hypothetical protein